MCYFLIFFINSTTFAVFWYFLISPILRRFWLCFGLFACLLAFITATTIMGDNIPIAGPSTAPDVVLPLDPLQNEFHDDGEYVHRQLSVGEILVMWNLMDIVRELGTNE